MPRFHLDGFLGLGGRIREGVSIWVSRRTDAHTDTSVVTLPDARAQTQQFHTMKSLFRSPIHVAAVREKIGCAPQQLDTLQVP